MDKIDLIRQTNKLIEKNAELEKFKSQTHLNNSSSSREWKRMPSLSPLRIGTPRNNVSLQGSAIKKQI